MRWERGGVGKIIEGPRIHEPSSKADREELAEPHATDDIRQLRGIFDEAYIGVVLLDVGLKVAAYLVGVQHAVGRHVAQVRRTAVAQPRILADRKAQAASASPFHARANVTGKEMVGAERSAHACLDVERHACEHG